MEWERSRSDATWVRVGQFAHPHPALRADLSHSVGEVYGWCVSKSHGKFVLACDDSNG